MNRENDQRGRSARAQPNMAKVFWDFLNRPRYDMTMEAMQGGPRGPMVDMVRSMPVMDQAALGTAALPVVGDLVGLAADARRYAQEPESRTMGNFGLSALGMLPFIPGMTVFHGTPHRFMPEPDAPHGRFRLDKIGTGEGAQAYGHGIYVAESPDVAKQYQAMNKGETLTIRRGDDLLAAGDEIDDKGLEAVKYLQLGERRAGEFKHNKAYYAKQAYLESLGNKPELVNNPNAQEVLKRIDEYKDAKIGYENISSLYSVDLPDEQIAKMLDWDAPLSEQPESVRQTLRGLVDDEFGEGFFDAYAKTGADWSDLRENLWEMKSAAEESQLLLEAGIPGVRYLDGTSRKAGEGTRNFVLFDPEVAKIIDRK